MRYNYFMLYFSILINTSKFHINKNKLKYQHNVVLLNVFLNFRMAAFVRNSWCRTKTIIFIKAEISGKDSKYVLRRIELCYNKFLKINFPIL
ncbi:unnamed protein product [Rhizophagus irregularis]|nr:unnamed protein product [Rhizophagus irregularis]